MQLLTQDANVNAKNYDSRTPLHVACTNNFFYIVEILVKSGADINVEDRWAARPIDEAHSKDIIDLLLKNGSRAERKNQIYRFLGAEKKP